MTASIMPETQTQQTHTLEVRRLIRAPRQRVFQAFTDPAELRKWYAPEGLSPDRVTLDAHQGGAYEVQMRKQPTPAGDRYPDLSIETGTYETVIPNELLVFSSTGDWNPTETTQVRIEFHQVPEGTEVVITQTLFQTEASRDGHQFGWNGALDKLNALLA